jgi:NAD(P)-dependent dehydrogenase (short-subunit alcohol dehydrogenase family)
VGEFDGTTALVSGAAGGIGSAAVEGLLAAGASVVAFDQSEAALAARWPGTIGVRTIAGDVSQTGDVTAAFNLVETLGQPLSAMIACAGVYNQYPIEQLPDDAWRRLIDVNLRGTFLCCRAAVRAMIPHRSGAIVTVSSSVAYGGLAGRAHYGASKAAISAFTRALAQEVGPHGIRANVIAPGTMDTAMPRSLPGRTEDEVQRGLVDNPLHHKGSPADVAALMLFLVSAASSHITGQIMHINAGALMP